ncbi:hypothetical protein FQN51_002620 [Onygenales sp. PD_10]|nr:hypothetical protein FQN51_002620 [Onygenales sp. PD_10]
MTDMVYPQRDLPRIQVSEDGPVPYSRSTNLDPMPRPIEGPFAMDASEPSFGTTTTRAVHMEAKISYLENSLSGYPPFPSTGGGDHGTIYSFGLPLTPQGDDEIHSFPARHLRYESPDQSATEHGSPFSELSWNCPSLYRHSESPATCSSLPSPPGDTLGQMELPIHSFVPKGEGSYCGSEYSSVSLRELQHIPDPISEQNFDSDIIERSYSIPQYFPMPTEAPELFYVYPNEQQAREPSDGVDEQILPSMNKPQHDEGDPSISDDTPRKRMRYSSAAKQESPSVSTTTTNRKSTRTRTTTHRIGKSGRKSMTSAPRGPHSSRSRQGNNDRIYTCVFAPYGCPSIFSAKNEWKRHVSSQHLQLHFYRCDVGYCNVSKPTPAKGSSAGLAPRTPNDFNRKDLFTQHQRRMHSPWAAPNAGPPTKQEQDAFDRGLDKVRRRCRIERRAAPERSVCHFCGCEFSGQHCWDVRMEHVGKHYENGDRGVGEDIALRDWAISEGIIKSVGKGKWVLTTPKDGVGY